MRQRLLWSAIMLAGMVMPTTAQEPVPGPLGAAVDMQRVLAEWQSLQIQMLHVADALEKYRAASAGELAAAEAQKKTLIEWLEQAQSQGQK